MEMNAELRYRLAWLGVAEFGDYGIRRLRSFGRRRLRKQCGHDRKSISQLLCASICFTHTHQNNKTNWILNSGVLPFSSVFFVWSKTFASPCLSCTLNLQPPHNICFRTRHVYETFAFACVSFFFVYRYSDTYTKNIVGLCVRLFSYAYASRIYASCTNDLFIAIVKCAGFIHREFRILHVDT